MATSARYHFIRIAPGKGAFSSVEIWLTKTLHSECGSDAVIITPSSDNIIRTHKHRLGNKRELAFGATIGDGQLNQLCLRGLPCQR
jgi:hypothetical protein